MEKFSRKGYSKYLYVILNFGYFFDCKIKEQKSSVVLYFIFMLMYLCLQIQLELFSHFLFFHSYIPFNFRSIINVGAHRKTFPNNRAIIAYKASGSSLYIFECPNINGGFTIKIIPANTRNKLRISLGTMGSFRKNLA